MITLQFITHTNERYNTLEGAEMALKGGCRWVQLRIKDASYEILREQALQMQELCKSYHATFIIDDNVRLVKEIGADGVHLGLNDMPITEARQLLGTKYIIGGTANRFIELQQHYKSGADYIGCGPYRFTTTKEKLAPTLGLNGYKEILRDMSIHHYNIPLVAIGGILSKDLNYLKCIGIECVAMSSGILNNQDPIKETQKIIKLLA